MIVSFWSGKPQLAHEYCERALRALYDLHHHCSLALAFGFDPLMSCHGQGAWALWYLGYPNQALQRSQVMLTLARELAHPYTLAWVLNGDSWTHWYRWEGQAAYPCRRSNYSFGCRKSSILSIFCGSASKRVKIRFCELLVVCPGVAFLRKRLTRNCMAKSHG